jgi:hypothetical protein
MTASSWVLVGLAAGFVVLALYGKYRTLKDDYHAAVEEERRKQEPPPV